MSETEGTPIHPGERVVRPTVGRTTLPVGTNRAP